MAVGAAGPIDSPVGVIEKGTVAAQRFTWQGTDQRRASVITVRTNWMMDDGHLSDGWKLGEQRFEVEVDSTDAPPLIVTFHGLHPPVLGEDSWIDLIAAAMHCVNAIPYVVEAAPGIKTYLDLPLIAGRACVIEVPPGIVNAGDSTPPSTSKILPVTQLDASDTRYNDCGRDVNGLADAVHRRVGLELFTNGGVGEHRLEGRGLDAADLDRVDPDLGRELGRHRAGQHRQRGLRRGVRGERGLHHARRARRDVDDRTAPVLDHAGHDELAQQERRGHVEAQRGFEVALARLQERARHPTARVVHEDVEPAELGHRGIDQARQLIGVGHVGRHRQRPPAEIAHVRSRRSPGRSR